MLQKREQFLQTRLTVFLQKSLELNSHANARMERDDPGCDCKLSVSGLDVQRHNRVDGQRRKSINVTTADRDVGQRTPVSEFSVLRTHLNSRITGETRMLPALFINCWHTALRSYNVEPIVPPKDG